MTSSSSNSSSVMLISGTSRGLGAHLRTTLTEAGHVVYGSSRHADGSDPFELKLDVLDPDSCQRAIETIIAAHGRLDVLINNAGKHLHGAAIETSDAELRDQMELNFFGAVNLTSSALPVMIDARAGRIINISSIGGVLSTPFTSAYNASKFALEGYMESLRLELLSLNIYVCSLEPAFLNTGTSDVSIVPVNSPHPLFVQARQATHEQMLTESRAGLPLSRVTRVIERIISQKAPALRHAVDGRASRLLFARALTPRRLFERAVICQTAPALLTLDSSGR